jgi:ATP dependent DNA ligase domain
MASAAVMAITKWSISGSEKRTPAPGYDSSSLQSPLTNSIYLRMLQRTFPAGFIAPCLPTKTDKLPSGSQWLHEIKHDGFRVIARKNGPRVRLYCRPGNDFTRRFPLIVDALARLPACPLAPASSMARLSPAMATALPRSISSGTTALTTACFYTPST